LQMKFHNKLLLISSGKNMSCTTSYVLVVDDDRNLAKILVNILEFEGYECLVANDGETAMQWLEERNYDLVLLDLALPDMSGLDILQIINKADNIYATQVVMISGQGCIHTALRATRLGAYDFLEKPLNTERVLVTIKNALEKGRLQRAKNRFIHDMKEKYIMIGDSDPMKKVNELILRAAATDSKVLIEGENGTGKELVARAIYYNSDRSGESFITVNCAAIPDNLVESELFGHKKGTFTGAIADKIGRFQMADRGTLFMDEIGDMRLMTQAKLLRALESNKIEMLGSTKTIDVDVRIISATNRNLQDAMIQGEFREDLFYRLNVLSVKLPPLRERRSDIPLLVNHFLRLFCEEQGKITKKIAGAAMKAIQEHTWPGNVRELRNIIEKIVTMVDSDVINKTCIMPFLKSAGLTQMDMSSGLSFKDAKMNFERRLIIDKLTEYNWNITLTANSLKMPRTYLYKKIRNLNIEQVV